MNILSMALIQSTSILLFLVGVLWLLRRRAAATKHLVCAAGFIALLLLPAFNVLLPKWKVLPQLGLGTTEVRNHEGLHRDQPSRGELTSSFSSFISAETTTTENESRSTESPTITAPAVLGSSIPKTERGRSEDKSQQQASTPDWFTSQRIPQIAIAIWLTGTCLLFARVIASCVLLQWRAKTSQIVESGREFDMLVELCQQTNLRKPVRLHCSDTRTMPMTWGFFNAKLLIPSEAKDWDEQQLESVLRHELEHLRRRDSLCYVLVHVVCAAYWFNPLVWIAARQIFAESERACDDSVLRSGVSPSVYASHILSVASNYDTAKMAIGSAAMAQVSCIELRIKKILDGSQLRKEVNSRAVMVTLAITLLCIMLIGVVRAAEPLPLEEIERPLAENFINESDDKPASPKPDSNDKEVNGEFG